MPPDQGKIKPDLLQRMNIILHSDLPESEKMMLIAVSHYQGNNSAAWANAKTLAANCSKSERSVRRTIESLVKRGYLVRTRRRNQCSLLSINWAFFECSERSSVTVEETENGHPRPPERSPMTVEETENGHPRPPERSPVTVDESRTVTHDRQNGHQWPTEQPKEQPIKKNNPKNNPVREQKFKPEEIDLPDELDTEAFRAAWREWCEFRRQKKKTISKKAAEKQLLNLARFTAEIAIQAIEKSIANDWQGLFPEKECRNNEPRHRIDTGPGRKYDPVAQHSETGF